MASFDDDRLCFERIGNLESASLAAGLVPDQVTLYRLFEQDLPPKYR